MESTTSAMVNLTDDREPIHTPGSVQPHGILFVLSEPDLTIEQVSANTEALIHISPKKLLGKNLSILLENQRIQAIRNCLQGDFEHINPLKLSILSQESALPFDGIIHRSSQNKLMLELEPTVADHDHSFFSFYQTTRGILAKMQRAETLTDLCTVMVEQVRRITGFDRVMIYRFDLDDSGIVMAEAKSEELEPYLGLHYPASDIPPAVRQLFALNPLRLIVDIAAAPAVILPARPLSIPPSPHPPIPLDLSFSVLRSIFPCHIEYLKNMGVAASMSISLVKDQKLWGLIACHHQTAKLVPYEIRTICEFLGQVMALELSTKQENEDLERKLMLKSLQSQFIETLSYAEDFTDGLVQNREELLDLVGAEGAVICAAGHLTLMGKTPTEPEILNLLDWLQNRFENDLFVTNSLPALYPEALKFKQVASGLLALSITRIQKNYVLWFRPEVLQYVNWAGAAENPVQQQADGSLVLSPRQSFQLWQETVRDKSLPWQSWEIAGAIELRSAIVSIVLRKADELAAINLELERSNNELDAFAYIASHDLKEPLRGIYNYSTFLLEDYMNILDQEGIDKLETLIRLTKRMEDLINSLLHFSRLGRQELHLRSLDLNQLVHNVAEIFQMSQGETANIQILIPKELPAVRGDHILIEEVLTNLIGNAIKYNDQTEKRAEIGCLDSNPNLLESEPENSPFWTFYVRDNGIGIRDKHLDMIFRIFKRLHAPGKYGGGTGAGLTIVKKILELHGGKIWVESSYGEGSTFFFTLPV